MPSDHSVEQVGRFVTCLFVTACVTVVPIVIISIYMVVPVLINYAVESFALRFPVETAVGARQGMFEFGQQLMDNSLHKRCG